MRILHVVPSYLPAARYGGPVFAVHHLCRALAARGHDISVFTTNIDGDQTSDVSTAHPVMRDGVSVSYFSSPVMRRLSFAPAMANAIARRMHEFDLFHLHTVFQWPTTVAARHAGRAQIPYVVSPRGMLVRELIARRNRLVKKFWIAALERKNVESARAIHVTSGVEERELRRFEWRLPHVETIANGVDEPEPIDVDRVSADVRAIVQDGPYVLFLGRISWKKGIERLIHAAKVVDDMPRLVVAGPDDENLVPQLSRLAHDLGIADRVRFLPRVVTGDDKEFLYASATIFVLPSVSENFGNTVLEAMQHARPVVVTPDVGAAEIVRMSGGGIVADGDPVKLGQSIRGVLANPNVAKEMGEAGRRHVRAHLSWAHAAEQMEALYLRVLG